MAPMSMLFLLSLFMLHASMSCCDAFSPPSAGACLLTIHPRRSVASSAQFTSSNSRLFVSQHKNNDGDDDEGEGDGVDKKSFSTGRVGGRRISPKNDGKKKKKKGGFVPGCLVVAAVPLLILWLMFQSIFGRGNDSYVYYQSSVYESSVVGESGKIERSRKESVRTNVPSLLPEQQQGKDQRLLRQIGPADAAFDRALDREMQTMFDEFF
mmetsp:Transcript_20793/g.34371  ORF Transcript_20793/g.34371 Transcript_20793/m.34371 type:complete len:210 (-) Transcript_20793:123-752(-)